MTDTVAASTRTPFALTGSPRPPPPPRRRPRGRARAGPPGARGGRGLGREIALELAGQGADVVLGVRDPSGSAELVDELRAFGVRATAIRMDVLDLAASRSAIDAVTADLGPIDILVNNAGGGVDAP